MKHSTNFSEPHTLDQVGTGCVKIKLTEKLVLCCRCGGFSGVCCRRKRCRCGRTIRQCRRGNCWRRTTCWCRVHFCSRFSVFFGFFGTFFWTTLLADHKFRTSVEIIDKCDYCCAFKHVGVISRVLWAEVNGKIVAIAKLLHVDREMRCFDLVADFQGIAWVCVLFDAAFQNSVYLLVQPISAWSRSLGWLSWLIVVNWYRQRKGD